MCKFLVEVLWHTDMLPVVHGDEVEFRWTGNKVFLPGDVDKLVGKVYDTYLMGDMAHFYSASGTNTKTTKKAAGSQPQFSMAVELYIDKLKVSCLVCSIHFFSMFNILYSLCFNNALLITLISESRALQSQVESAPINKCHAILHKGGKSHSDTF